MPQPSLDHPLPGLFVWRRGQHTGEGTRSNALRTDAPRRRVLAVWSLTVGELASGVWVRVGWHPVPYGCTPWSRSAVSRGATARQADAKRRGARGAA